MRRGEGGYPRFFSGGFADRKAVAIDMADDTRLPRSQSRVSVEIQDRRSQSRVSVEIQDRVEGGDNGVVVLRDCTIRGAPAEFIPRITASQVSPGPPRS